MKIRVFLLLLISASMPALAAEVPTTSVAVEQVDPEFIDSLDQQESVQLTDDQIILPNGKSLQQFSDEHPELHKK